MADKIYELAKKLRKQVELSPKIILTRIII